MPVVASIAVGSDLLEGDELVAISGNEEVGRATVQILPNGRKRFFIVVSSEVGSALTWEHQRNGVTVEVARSNVAYMSMSIVGSIENPLEIDFVNGVDSQKTVQYYTIDGVRVNGADDVQKRILIGEDGTKVLK